MESKVSSPTKVTMARTFLSSLRVTPWANFYLTTSMQEKRDTEIVEDKCGITELHVHLGVSRISILILYVQTKFCCKMKTCCHRDFESRVETIHQIHRYNPELFSHFPNRLITFRNASGCEPRFKESLSLRKIQGYSYQEKEDIWHILRSKFS